MSLLSWVYKLVYNQSVLFAQDGQSESPFSHMDMVIPGIINQDDKSGWQDQASGYSIRDKMKSGTSKTGTGCPGGQEHDREGDLVLILVDDWFK